jgi:hypothetical protein
MMGGARLEHADCFDVFPALAAGSVDMVLADLPFGTTNCAWDSQLPLDRLWAEYTRICSGPIVLFAQTPFDKVLGASNLPMLRYEWIWEKGNATGHLNARRAPMKAHENILVFYDRQPTYNPIKTTGHPRKRAVRKPGTSPIYNYHEGGEPYDSTERFPRSIIPFSSEKQRGAKHPTQKPVDLCEYLIRTYTNEGDVVLDNVMGSGTTGVAARKCGRSFIGIEKSADYFELAQRRLSAFPSDNIIRQARSAA